jgi:uncharacterized protein (TIRG00374 family)
VVVSAGGLADAWRVARRLQAVWLLAALVASAFRLVCYSLQLARLARSTGSLPARAVAVLGLTLYGFGAVTPAAPAEGLALAGAQLRERDRSPSQVALILGFSEWFTQRTFYAVAALDVTVVAATGRLRMGTVWPVVAAVVVLVALVVTAVLARRPSTAARLAVAAGALRRRGSRPPVERRREAGLRFHADAMRLVGSASNRLRTAALSTAAVLADAAILWSALRATGFSLRPELAVLSIAIGTVVGWVPGLPAGLGLVDAAVPAVLHHYGAPLDLALAATLAYRAIGTALPALAGVVALGLHRGVGRRGRSVVP